MSIVRSPSDGIDRRHALKLIAAGLTATAVTVIVPNAAAAPPPLTEEQITRLARQTAHGMLSAMSTCLDHFNQIGGAEPFERLVMNAWRSLFADLRERYPKDAGEIVRRAGVLVADALDPLLEELGLA